MLSVVTVCQLAGMGLGLKGLGVAAGLVVFAYRKKIRHWIDKSYDSDVQKKRVIDEIYKIANKEVTDVEMDQYLKFEIGELKSMKSLFSDYGKDDPVSEKFLKMFKDHYSELYNIYIGKLQ